jgi:hypothetical protein
VGERDERMMKLNLHPRFMLNYPSSNQKAIHTKCCKFLTEFTLDSVSIFPDYYKSFFPSTEKINSFW